MPFSLADRLVLKPSLDRVEVDTSLARQHFVARSDACRTEVYRVRPDFVGWDAAPAAFVLQLMGNSGRAERAVPYAAKLWANRPVELWIANHPGCGGSDGPSALRALASSALAVYNALAIEANGRPIVVMGNSLGTAVALHVGISRPVHGLILTNPTPLPQLIRGKHGRWNGYLLSTPVSWMIPRALDALRAARQCRVPAIFVCAGQDRTVPMPYQQRVVEDYAGEKTLRVRHGADHNDPMDADDVGWLQGQIDGMLNIDRSSTSTAQQVR